MLNRHRQTSIDQLSPEPLQVQIYQADFGDLRLIHGIPNGPICNRGTRPENFILFAIPLSSEQRFFIHNQPIFSHTLSCFDCSRGSVTVIPANTLFVELHIRRDLFETTLQAMRRDDLDARFFRQDFIHLPQTILPYRNYVQELVHLVRTKSPLLQTPEYRQMILGDVIPLLIDVIPRQKNPCVAPSSIAHRANLARQATDFIQSHLHQPLTLKDIYQALGISRRTLFNSFENTFGATPIQYLKAQRLQGARKALKKSAPQTITVAQIANQWGYWDAAQFTKAYKKMFGELPSETLKEGV